MQARKRLVGVIGSSVGTPEQLAQAHAVGRLIAERGADIPDLPAAVAAGLSREEQTRQLEQFLISRLCERIE